VEILSCKGARKKGTWESLLKRKFRGPGVLLKGRKSGKERLRGGAGGPSLKGLLRSERTDFDGGRKKKLRGRSPGSLGGELFPCQVLRLIYETGEVEEGNAGDPGRVVFLGGKHPAGIGGKRELSLCDRGTFANREKTETAEKGKGHGPSTTDPDY